MTESLTFADCQNYAISRGGLCLSTEYIDNNSYIYPGIMKWLCNYCKTEWPTTFSHIKNSKSG
jgi:hypothetical protein